MCTALTRHPPCGALPIPPAHSFQCHIPLTWASSISPLTCHPLMFLSPVTRHPVTHHPSPRHPVTHGFQHAYVKSFDRAIAVARVALQTECKARNTAAGVLK